MRFALFLAGIAATLPLSASAQTPGDVADLVGARAAGGETQMESRGWVHIKTEKGDDRAWSYWWNPAQRQCVSIAVVEGRFDAITRTLAPDCNQASESSYSGERAPTRGSVPLNDLVTMRASSADVELQRRGFKTLRAYQAGESAYTIRSNDATGQCVQVAVTDGRIRYIAPLGRKTCR